MRFYILTDNDKFVGCVGWNPHDTLNSTALILTVHIIPSYRSRQLFASLCVEPMLVDIHAVGTCDRVWITCNGYNHGIYRYLEKFQTDPSSVTLWHPIFRKFVPIGEHVVYSTTQYVAEYQLQPNYNS